MRCVISIAEHEREMAFKWFDWVSELGGTEGHSLHIIPAAGMDMKEIYAKADKAFPHSGVTTQIDYEEQTSDWQNRELIRSASGPNSAFRQVAWHIFQNKTGPWFWCELDCIPTRKDWLDRLEAEYKSCGKPFMGAQVLIETVPEHMSGNAVYPQNVPEEAPLLVMRTAWKPKGQEQRFELAFDVAGAKDVLPKAHWTNLIQHIFRHKGFESRAEFDATIDPNAVVFHSCKDGSIFKYLRENLSGVTSETKRQCVGVKTLAESQTDSQFEPEGASSIRDVAPTQELRGAGEVSLPGGSLTKPAPLQPKGGDDLRRTDATATSKESTEFTNSGVVPLSNAEPTVQSVGSATVFTKTFPMNMGQTRSCPYCQTPPDKWCPYCRAWKDPNYEQQLENVIKQNAAIRNGLPAMSPPWENREDSERDVKMLCDTLALFAKAPIYKSRVRNALRKAKIIK